MQNRSKLKHTQNGIFSKFGLQPLSRLPTMFLNKCSSRFFAEKIMLKGRQQTKF